MIFFLFSLRELLFSDHKPNFAGKLNLCFIVFKTGKFTDVSGSCSSCLQFSPREIVCIRNLIEVDLYSLGRIPRRCWLGWSSPRVAAKNFKLSCKDAIFLYLIQTGLWLKSSQCFVLSGIRIFFWSQQL